MIMGTVEWFIVGGIIVAALDQLIEYSPWKSNNVLQLILDGLQTIFRMGGKK
jgi:hypothetical protein